MLVLPKVITHLEAPACLKVFLQSIDRLDGPIEADASPLQTFDSSVIALLLQCRRHASMQGKYFLVSSLPATLLSLAQVYGIQELLTDTDTQTPAESPDPR